MVGIAYPAHLLTVNEFPSHVSLATIYFIMSAVGLVTNALLLHAAAKRSYPMMLPWLIISAIDIFPFLFAWLALTASTFSAAPLGDAFLNIGSAVFVLIVQAYFWYCVFSYCWTLKEEEEEVQRKLEQA